MKKIISTLLVTSLISASLAGCSAASATGAKSEFDSSREISVISREDGSGTRGAFIELFGVEVKDENGSKSDKTTKEAVIAPKTDIMLTNVAGDPHAIGYISLGSLNDTVRALDIDGVTASVENIKAGTYKIARPFNIAIKGEATGLTKDFIDFILSAEGQEVVSHGYIAISDSPVPYSGTRPSGKIVVAGSSSVTPIMEKLKEAYSAINPDAKIEIQQSDSSTGMQGAIDGTCDIGMASRDLKDSEKETLTEISIAIDGIAVIVNNQNPATGLSSESVRAIYTGETTKWDQAK